MQTFFAMGGYAGFVWPAYGLSIAALATATALTLRAYGRARTRLGALESGSRR